MSVGDESIDTSEIDTKEDPDYCWLWSKGRGVGTIPTSCNDGKENNAGLCYPPCDRASGYRGVGPVCWLDCPRDYTDTGLFCHSNIPAVISPVCDPNSAFPSQMGINGRCYHAGIQFENIIAIPSASECPSGYNTYPLSCTGCSGDWWNPFSWHCNTLARSPFCNDGYELTNCVGNLCSCTASSVDGFCPDGYTRTTAITCGLNVPPEWVGITTIALDLPKKSYGRGVGTIPDCAGDQEKQWGLCYPRCEAGKIGIGPVCWGQCDSTAGYRSCGVGCAKNDGICAKVVGNILMNVYALVGDVVTFGATSVGRKVVKTVLDATDTAAKVTGLNKLKNAVKAMSAATKAKFPKAAAIYGKSIKTATKLKDAGLSKLKKVKEWYDHDKKVYDKWKNGYDMINGIKGLIEESSSNSVSQNLIDTTNLLSTVDPTSLSGVALAFVYPTCGIEVDWEVDTPFSF